MDLIDPILVLSNLESRGTLQLTLGLEMVKWMNRGAQRQKMINKQNDMAGGPLRTCSSGPWWPDGERDVRVV